MTTDLQDLSRRLFQTANQLWTNTDLRPDQYAQPVLALIALRQMEARFGQVDAKLPRGGGSASPPRLTTPGARSFCRRMRASLTCSACRKQKIWPRR